MKMDEIKVRRSLREVLPPKRAQSVPPPPKPQYVRTSRAPRRFRLGWFVGAVFVLVFVIFFGTLALARVTVEITPTLINLPLSDTLTISRDGKGLAFDVVTLPTQTASKVVKVSGTEKVSRSASGQIVIYNNYSSAAQKLIANTRFQTENGKVYRIRDAITVPGTKIVNGKVTPGSVETTVYADAPGADYNGEATDFTIPGFKGDPRFDKFFARSKTALTGGFIGEAPNLSEEEESRTRAQLRADITRDLLNEARTKIPETFILLDSLALVDVKDVSDLGFSDNGSAVTLKESATLTAIILPRAGLLEKLVGARVPGFTPGDLEINNMADLRIAFNNTPTNSLMEVKEETLQVSGSVVLTPIINQIDLASKLAGVKKSEIDEVVSQVRGLEKIKVTYRPPWLRGIPSDPTRITFKFPVS
ncbi:hypothetical protein IT398_02530 [Candidatus Nomurabacteria bacterium]|nr:hypothetical protein [Candidatus Nomurabacteria bacterium]